MRRARTAPKIDTVTFGFMCVRGFQKPMAAADQHNEIEVNFVEQGLMLFRRGAEAVKLEKGTAAIYWAAVPHQVVAVEPQTKICCFILPLAWFLGWKLSQEFNRKMLGGEMIVLKQAAPGLRLPSFTDWADDFARSPDLKIAVRLEIEAFFRRLAANSARSSSKSSTLFPEEHLCRHVERMVGIMTERFREPLSIREIARDAGLNPEYAMRLFRSRWGVTIWTFLLQQRIAEARRLLLLSDTPLVEIAFECGFRSVGRFYHAFKSHCQCSPGTYRRNHADVCQSAPYLLARR